ncbi:hypothetical protein OFN61_32080, partial [Escherichia coli]|nr:hypothetical protein [Escherichia coli]
DDGGACKRDRGEQADFVQVEERAGEGEDDEVDKEKLAMRKELRELRMEVEILKKAALIFGRVG